MISLRQRFSLAVGGAVGVGLVLACPSSVAGAEPSDEGTTDPTVSSVVFESPISELRTPLPESESVSEVFEGMMIDADAVDWEVVNDVLFVSSASYTVDSVPIDGEDEIDIPAISVTASAADDSYPLQVYCDRFYSFSDPVGTYTVQRQCGVQSAPWSFQFSPGAQKIPAGSVSEQGMDWWVNGTKMPRQAPHSFYPSNYVFHGTYSGVRKKDRLRYYDLFNWTDKTGNPGGAVIKGNYQFAGRSTNVHCLAESIDGASGVDYGIDNGCSDV